VGEEFPKSPARCHAQWQMSELSHADSPATPAVEVDGSPENGSASVATTLASTFHTLRNSLIGLVVFFALLTGLLFAVPSLRTAAERIEHANLWWVAVGAAMEVLSCAGFVVLFGFVFDKLGRRMTSRLSLAELAVNSVVSISGVGGIALGAWVLRSKGVSVERIAKRSVLIFLLTSAVNVIAVVIFGVLMAFGLLSGSVNPLLTLLPAAAALVSVVVILALARWAEQLSRREEFAHGRKAVALTALSGGVQDAVIAIRQHDWRLLGSVAYWFFDNLTLFVCFEAYGHRAAFGAVVMAYLVGMLANSIPIPGGFGAVEGGLVGMLVLYGERPVSVVVAAVITYRAIALWVPSIIGSIAFLSLRREMSRTSQVAPAPAAGG
jgi:uncharacterized protein (TIRG00374 family)